MVGYITQTEPDIEPVQPDSVGFALRVLMSPVPTACVVLACICLQWYPITEGPVKGKYLIHVRTID